MGDTRILMTINTNCVTWSILTIQKNIGNKSDRWYLTIKTEGIGWKLMLGCWIGKKKAKTKDKSFLPDQLYNDYRSPVRDWDLDLKLRFTDLYTGYYFYPFSSLSISHTEEIKR